MPVRRNLIASGVVVEPVLAHTVDHTYRSRCPVTLQIITWNWGSPGIAWSAGVHSGRGPPRIVWITCTSDTAWVCLWNSRRWGGISPVDGETLNLEQSIVFGRIRHCNGCYVVP